MNIGNLLKIMERQTESPDLNPANSNQNNSYNQLSQHNTDKQPPATTGRRVIQVQQQHKFVKIERSQTYGFGFILRGTRSHTDKKTEFQPSNLYPARQFLESVDLNGPAGAAGLAAGDYLINVNNADVRTWGHDDLVQLIRSQHSMTMHVISVTKHKGTTVGFEIFEIRNCNKNNFRIYEIEHM